MTRAEAEQAIMQKLKEIREIALAYAPERDHVSMFFIGPHISLSNCEKVSETGGILDCYEVVGDGKGIWSQPHGEASHAKG